MTLATDALPRPRDGNRRCVAHRVHRITETGDARRDELTGGQEPFAIILGCSDSRVPAELVFDQGLGDLFVIRVAGNVVAPSQIGSVEFAADAFGSRLVVVLGHSGCGAVAATLIWATQRDKSTYVAFQALQAAGIAVGQDLEGLTVREAVQRFQAGDVPVADAPNSRGHRS